MSANELASTGTPLIEQTGNFTDTQTQVLRALSLIIAGQELPKDLEIAPEVIENITAFSKTEPKTVRNAELLLPEDFREKILVIALPEQQEALAQTRIFLAGDFTGWEDGSWSFTHLAKNVFALKGKGVVGQSCKFYANHKDIFVGTLAKMLTKSGIEQPGVDGNKGNAWFLSGGQRPTSSHQNDIW